MELEEALMIELAYCRQAELAVSETASRIAALVTREHVSWGAGEPDCPPELKSRNGELHTLRCKVCGQYGMDGICLPNEVLP